MLSPAGEKRFDGALISLTVNSVVPSLFPTFRWWCFPCCTPAILEDTFIFFLGSRLFFRSFPKTPPFSSKVFQHCQPSPLPPLFLQTPPPKFIHLFPLVVFFNWMTVLSVLFEDPKVILKFLSSLFQNKAFFYSGFRCLPIYLLFTPPWLKRLGPLFGRDSSIPRLFEPSYFSTRFRAPCTRVCCRFSCNSTRLH